MDTDLGECCPLICCERADESRSKMGLCVRCWTSAGRSRVGEVLLWTNEDWRFTNTAMSVLTLLLIWPR